MNIHLAAAQRAAGLDYPGLLARVCIVPPTGSDAAAGRRRAGGVNGLTPAAAAPREEVVPPRAQWYQEPRQIFDNFYWVGNNSRNSWVIKTSAGLIVIDTLFHYSVEPEIVEGIKKLGMDPRQIKYVLISHGHGDHDEGAKILQDLGARIIMTSGVVARLPRVVPGRGLAPEPHDGRCPMSAAFQVAPAGAMQTPPD